MGDKIDKLPTDDTNTPAKHDMIMVSSLFQDTKQTSKVEYEFKDYIIGGILFVILSSQLFDKFIKSCGCNGIYTLGIKLVCFIILFYILKKRLS